jgi:hypothetical protein
MPAGRLVYHVDDGFMVITAVGSPSPVDRRTTFEAIRADPHVPDGSLLLLDTRRLTDVMTDLEGERRMSELLAGLGPKMGTRCAVLASGANPVATHFFQAAGGAYGVRVGLFDNETAARLWLTASLRE